MVFFPVGSMATLWASEVKGKSLSLTHSRQHDVENEASDGHRPAHGGDGVPQAGVALRQLLSRRPVAVHHHRLMRVAHQVPGHHRAPVPPSHVVLPLEVGGRGRGGGTSAVHHLHLGFEWLLMLLLLVLVAILMLLSLLKLLLMVVLSLLYRAVVAAVLIVAVKIVVVVGGGGVVVTRPHLTFKNDFQSSFSLLKIVSPIRSALLHYKRRQSIWVKDGTYCQD